MSVGGGVATVVSKAVAEAMTVVAVVSVSIGISISNPLSTGPINCALEAKTVGGGPCWGETTGANKGVSVGEKAMAVVSVVGVSVSLWGSKCKCHQAGDDPC